MITRPSLIISGGQTGADQGGLFAAEALGINTGGWAPKGYLTETGESPWLGSRFRLVEHNTSYDYWTRTKANVEMADATVIIGKRSRGSNLTERLCGELEKPMIWLNFPIELLRQSVIPRTKLRLYLARVHPEILNIAGNRESVNPGLQRAVKELLERVFE